MKRIALCILSMLLLITLATPVFAHGGRTDSSGGHTDRSTGEYHYHHGYSAHDHWDMDGDGDLDCPYEFKDTTTKNNQSSSTDEKRSWATKNPPTNNRASNENNTEKWENFLTDVLIYANEDDIETDANDDGKDPKRSGVGVVILEFVAPIVLVYIIAGVCVLFINLKECVDQYRYRRKRAKEKENQICIPKKKKKN